MDVKRLIHNIFNLNYNHRSRLLQSITPKSSQLKVLNCDFPDLSNQERRLGFYRELERINSFEANQLKFHIALNFQDNEIVTKIWNSTNINLIRYAIGRSEKLILNQAWRPKLQIELNQISYSAQLEILKLIQSLKNTQLSEFGFDWVMKHQNPSLGYKLLPGCSDQFIQNYLNQNGELIPAQIIEKFLKTNRGKLIFPLIEKSLQLDKEVREVHGFYYKLVMSYYPEKFIELLFKYYPKLYHVIGNWKKIVIFNPELVYDLIMKNVDEFGLPDFIIRKEIISYYSDQQILDLIIKLLDTRDARNLYKPLLSILSRPLRSVLCLNIHDKLKQSDRSDYLIDLVQSEDTFNLLDHEFKSKIIQMIINGDENKLNAELSNKESNTLSQFQSVSLLYINNKLNRWDFFGLDIIRIAFTGPYFSNLQLKSNFKRLSKLSVDDNYEELVQLLKKNGDSPEDRNRALRIFVRSICNGPNESEYLNKFLTMIHERYRNDQPMVHESWLYDLEHKYFRLLNWEHLQTLSTLVECWKLKPRQNTSSIQSVLKIFWKILKINIDRHVSNTIQCGNLLNLEQCVSLLVTLVKANSRNDITQDYFANCFDFISYSKTGNLRSTFHLELIEGYIERLYPNLTKCGNLDHMKNVLNGLELLFCKSLLVRVPQVISILENFSDSENEFDYLKIPLEYHRYKPVDKEWLFQISPKIPNNKYFLLEDTMFKTQQSIEDYWRETVQVKNPVYIELQTRFPELYYYLLSSIFRFGSQIYNKMSLNDKYLLIDMIKSLLVDNECPEYMKKDAVLWITRFPQWWDKETDYHKYLPTVNNSNARTQDAKEELNQKDLLVLIDYDPEDTNSNLINPQSYSNELKSVFLTCLSQMPGPLKALHIAFPYFKSDFSNLTIGTVSSQIKRFPYNQFFVQIQAILSKGVKITVQKELVRLIFDISYPDDINSKFKELWKFCNIHSSLVKTLLNEIPEIAPHLTDLRMLYGICEELIRDPSYYDLVVSNCSKCLMKSDYRKDYIKLVFDNLPKENLETYYPVLIGFMESYIEFINDDYFHTFVLEMGLKDHFSNSCPSLLSYLVSVCYDFNSKWDNMSRMKLIINQIESNFEKTDEKNKLKMADNFNKITSSLVSGLKLKNIDLDQIPQLEQNFILFMKFWGKLVKDEYINFTKYIDYFKFGITLIEVKNYHLFENDIEQYYTTVGSELLQFLLGQKLNYISYRPIHLPVFGVGIHHDFRIHFFESRNIKHIDALMKGMEEGFKSPTIAITLIEIFFLFIKAFEIYDKDFKIDQYPNIQRIFNYLNSHEEYHLIAKNYKTVIPIHRPLSSYRIW